VPLEYPPLLRLKSPTDSASPPRAVVPTRALRVTFFLSLRPRSRAHVSLGPRVYSLRIMPLVTDLANKPKWISLRARLNGIISSFIAIFLPVVSLFSSFLDVKRALPAIKSGLPGLRRVPGY